MDPTPATPSMPISLGTHVIAPEQLALILAHVAALAKTALHVGDTLPLTADASDFIAALEEAAP